MRYVVYVFQKLFGYSREKATKLMLQVHNDGKAVVRVGPKSECERVGRILAEIGLRVTVAES